MAQHLVVPIILFGACLWVNTVAFSAVPSRGSSRRASLNNDVSSVRLQLLADNDDEEYTPTDRRSMIIKTASVVSSSLFVATALSNPANAGIDVTALKALPVEGELGVKWKVSQADNRQQHLYFCTT